MIACTADDHRAQQMIMRGRRQPTPTAAGDVLRRAVQHFPGAQTALNLACQTTGHRCSPNRALSESSSSSSGSGSSSSSSSGSGSGSSNSSSSISSSNSSRRLERVERLVVGLFVVSPVRHICFPYAARACT